MSQDELLSRLKSKKVLLAAMVLLILVAVLVIGRFAMKGQSGKSTPAASSGRSAPAKPTGGSAKGGSGGAAAGGIAACDPQKLPSEAKQIIAAIRAGGPFQHPRNDGVTFRNAERRLPQKDSGYYREYTVPTPGAPNRGARRIVTGGDPQKNPPDWYYTGDHYDSFCKITAP
ncbi:ribonuclease domain-containing protein [Austwickia chelonae]|uniref:ribonuclease domain-containing protein n=1 Tax=Austwickia chelonae TaxID=100225 RepID=UPI000E282F48|nr:ribonuclease domain-containing protein [Austwickia chelonae]